MSTLEFFASRTAVLATMHRKEDVIAPLLEQELGLQIVVPQNFNTDRFGTFSREVKRAGSQLEAARIKAQAAMQATGAAIALASEGAFGPPPGYALFALQSRIGAAARLAKSIGNCRRSPFYRNKL